MKIKTFSPATPKIYAYTTPGVSYHKGCTKIGYTEHDVDARIKDQTRTAGILPRKEWEENAVIGGKFSGYGLSFVLEALRRKGG